MEKLSVRRQELLNSEEPKYVFRFGPEGMRINSDDVASLGEIARAVVSFLTALAAWYWENSNHWATGILRKGYPAAYNHVRGRLWPNLPRVVMVDVVWTSTGWKIVEIDATNRNALGYPPLLRELYSLPASFGEIQNAFVDVSGLTQIMADQYRFYEPYYRYFLNLTGGQLICEREIKEWLQTADSPLLDLPPLYHSHDHMDALLSRAEQSRVVIPPFHWMSSKAAIALAFEIDELRNVINKFVGDSRLLYRRAEIPSGDFFVKLLQSGGAHGTFHNDHEALARYRGEKKALAIWQAALPIERREIPVLSECGSIKIEKRFVRCSIFVDTLTSKIVDADITACDVPIVHGGKEAVMTVPVL